MKATKEKAKKLVNPTNESCNRPGTIYTKNGKINIAHFINLPTDLQEKIKEALLNTGLEITDANIVDGDLTFPKFSSPAASGNSINRAKLIGQLIGQASIKTGYDPRLKFGKLIPNKQLREQLDFNWIKMQATHLATFLDEKKEEIAAALSDYECYNVVMDEIERSRDFLLNLDKNAEYFQEKAGDVTSFLPINQPLYAAICFGVVPSYMANTCIRVSGDMQAAFRKLDDIVNFTKFAPQLSISYDERSEFIRKRKESTQTVIFTGKPENGLAVKKHFKSDVLFILNGAGHNPIVVTPTADIDSAVESTLTVCLQNQGQDCAAPNAILVQNAIIEEFKSQLLKKLEEVQNCVGPYKDRQNIIGPNTRKDHTLKIATLLSKNREHCIYGGNINVITGLIYPCVLEKPLEAGPNLEEFFAPIIMLQPYENDNDLAKYFEHPHYRPNAMYVTLFGESEYVEKLVDKGLHTPDNIIRNSNLHKAERGFLPYGGLGVAASSIHYLGDIIYGATLPQRDIYIHKVCPDATSAPAPIESRY